jgi:hypothetical protein
VDKFRGLFDLLLGLLDPLFHDQKILFFLQLSLPTFQPFVFVFNHFKSSCSTFELLLQYSDLIVSFSLLLERLVFEENHVLVDELVQLIIKFSDHLSYMLIHSCQTVN